MATNADIWRERNGTVQRIAQGVASGYTPSDVQADDRFYVLPPGESPVGPGAPGPLLDNLQLFADYENWSAGQPLPNRWDANSGITSLTDNNTVGEETASPLVGARSGDYTRSNSEYHESVATFDIGTKDWYVSAWVVCRDISQGNLPIFSLLDLTQGSGNNFVCQISSGAAEAIVRDGNNSWVNVRQGVNEGELAFVEFWRTGGTIYTQVNQTSSSSSITGTDTYETTLTVGGETDIDFFPGTIDNLVWELAPQGELQWPSESTWLYNGGAGRSWDEIKTYTP